MNIESSVPTPDSLSLCSDEKKQKTKVAGNEVLNIQLCTTLTLTEFEALHVFPK